MVASTDHPEGLPASLQVGLHLFLAERHAMSNCVDVHTDVVISTRNIDGERLIADLQAYELTAQECPEFGLEDPTTFYFYWFLGTENVRLMMRGKVLSITLGHHRSGHTQRDLQGVMNFLQRYLTIDDGSTLHVPCEVSDEFDGFRTRHHQEYKLCNQH
jgi:hypothetical protein